MFLVYILECSDGSLYVGCTNDLERRLNQHNNFKSGAHYTKIRRPVTLKYSEKFPTLKEARKREAELKKWNRNKKIELIKKKELNRSEEIGTEVSRPNVLKLKDGGEKRN